MHFSYTRLTPLLFLLAAASCTEQKLRQHPAAPPDGPQRNESAVDDTSYVCKWGPEGTYTFEVTATNEPTAGTRFNNGVNTVDIDQGSANNSYRCTPIWVPAPNGGPTTLTITEKLNGTTVDSVWVFYPSTATWIAKYPAGTTTITWPDAAYPTYPVQSGQGGYLFKFYDSPASGMCADQNAMNYGKPLPCVYGRLGDFVWNDANDNGIQDAGEVGIPNVTVNLQRCEGGTCSPAGTMMTDGTGHYLFDHLGAFEYHVCAVTPTGFTPAKTLQGSDRAMDSNGCPAATTLSATFPQDLTLDFGFVLTTATSCTDPTASNFGQPGACEYPVPACPAGSFTFGYEINGDLAIRYDQFPSPNDNSYGVNAIGWPNGHRFSDLYNSDHAGFQLVDPNGVVRLSFNVDYLTASTAADAPSGYKSLGVTGGDGKMIVGTADGITATTSLARNLNNINIPGLFSASHVQQFGSVNLLLNSPPTDPAHLTYNISDPLLAGWDFHDTYFVTIAAAKLASLGFDRSTWRVEPNLSQLHNSPAKPCPPGPASVEISGYNVKDKQVLITIKNTGGSAVYLTDVTLNWPAANGSLTQIKLDGDVVYDTPDLASGPISLTTAQLVADQNKRKIDPGTSDVYTLIFQNNANTNLALYTGTVTFSGVSLTVLPH